jgi:hypothetical protein
LFWDEVPATTINDAYCVSCYQHTLD